MMDFKLEPVQFTLLTYYCIINITAAVLTVTDKRRAQKKQWRVPERTLLLLGAAGGVEGVISVLALVNGYIPPTIHYSVPDEECDLDYTVNHGADRTLAYAVSNSLGFGGHNACIVFKKV